jgi:uncharacterized membrane-anchored protein YhcB (DUF1043 family)
METSLLSSNQKQQQQQQKETSSREQQLSWNQQQQQMETFFTGVAAFLEPTAAEDRDLVFFTPEEAAAGCNPRWHLIWLFKKIKVIAL